MASFKQLLGCAVFLVLTCGICADEYDVNAYCTLVKNGVKLASIQYCGTYYTCYNGIATKGSCNSDQSFDKNSQECKPKAQVNCFLDSKNPCLERKNGYVPVVGTCNGYTYCKNSVEIGKGQCPPNLIYYNQKCIDGICADNMYQEDKGGLSSVCQIMPNNMFFGSTLDCKTFQKCTKNQLTNGKCPDGHAFDAQTQICNYESSTSCSRVTGKALVPNRTPAEPCNAAQLNNQRADARSCSTYEVCDGSFWKPINCSNGQFYSTTTNTCEARRIATPNSACNRCQFSNNQFVNAVDPNCQAYQICKNGAYVGKGSCAAGYFDEASQACIGDQTGLGTYAQGHGACFNSTTDTKPTETEQIPSGSGSSGATKPDQTQSGSGSSDATKPDQTQSGSGSSDATKPDQTQSGSGSSDATKPDQTQSGSGSSDATKPDQTQSGSGSSDATKPDQTQSGSGSSDATKPDQTKSGSG